MNDFMIIIFFNLLFKVIINFIILIIKNKVNINKINDNNLAIIND